MKFVILTCDACDVRMERDAWKEWSRCRISMAGKDLSLYFCPDCKDAVEHLLGMAGDRVGRVLNAAGTAFMENPPQNDEGATNLTTDAMQSGENE